MPDPHVSLSFNTPHKQDVLYRVYQTLRDHLYPYPLLHRFAHLFAWGIIWCKLCVKHKKLLWRYPPEIFFDNLYLEKAIAEKADIYVAHDLTMLATAYRAAEITRAKLIYDSHEFYSEQSLVWLERLMWRKLEKKYISKPNAIITVNPSIGDVFKARYGLPHINIIYNAERLSALPLEKMQLLHRKFNLSPEQHILLYQGGLHSDRNLICLVKAMTYVTNKMICLVLLGDGKLHNKLKHLIEAYHLEKNVFLHSAVNQDVLLSYTMSADVGVIPYRANCLNNRFCTPNKLFEFIIAGLPIIASDLPELTKIIVGNDIGRVADTRNPKAFAKIIEATFSDMTKLEQYKNQLLIARQKINWQEESNKLIRIYEQVSMI